MADDEVFDAGDLNQVNAAQHEAARRERDDTETFRIWMSHPHGRDLLYRIAYDTCHLGETFYAVDNEGRSDTHKTYLHIGERNIGAWLDERMRRHPELYMRMLQEAEIEREARLSRVRKQNEAQDKRDG